jgi:isoquinoline 1-oxidoreductase beta subunit
MANTEKKEKKRGIKRRKFLKYSGLGLGLMIGGVWLARNPIRRKIFDTSETMIPPYMGDTNPLVWIQVTPESKIILHSSKVEMGQGTFTSLAQIVAEELEVSIDQIEVVHATTKTGNIDGFATGGSMSIAALWKPLSEMAATMREMLKTKAAEKLNIDINTLTVEEGKITGGGTTLSYGEIVAGITDWKMPKTPKLKDKSTYKFVGKPVPRVDLEDKILGVPIFGIDASYPDMVYASIVRSRLVDAHMSNFDTSEAQKMPGVIKVIKQNDFVGVVAKSHMEADLARHKIKFDYTKNQEWNLSDIKDKIKVGQGTKTIFQKEGKAIDDIKEEGEIIEMEFSSPIGAHAQLEPNGAVAYYKDGKVEIKISTQVVDITRKEVAKALGIEKADVNIIPTYLGGGFGRRLHTSHAVYVALMSKEVGKPVKCFFDRKQEFQNDTFRPPSHHILKAKVSDDGNLLGIEHQLASGDTMFNSVMAPSIATSILRADIGSIRGAAIMYDGIPEIRGTYYHVDLPFATSFWRSLGLLANAFAIESFLDEIALKTKQDPVAMRLKYLKDNNPYSQRIKKVITTCAERAGYTDIVVGNRAMGFAATIDTGSPCAQVAEVSIEDGKIKVHKVTVAFDCGVAVNPDQVKAQVEGCVCMGLSAALYERMDLKNNKLYPVNYGAYRIAMLRDTPREIDTVLIDGTGIPGPVGEPPLGPIAAAIGNAVRRLIGKRITELPMDLT